MLKCRLSILLFSGYHCNFEINNLFVRIYIKIFFIDFSHVLFIFYTKNLKVFSTSKKMRFFCPQDMIGLLRSNHCDWCCLCLYIYLPGVVIWQHIHPSTLHSFWEEGWQDSSCLRFFLAWEYRVQESFWYTGMRPRCHTDRTHHTHCSLTSNHRLSLLVHHSSIDYSLGSIPLEASFLLSRKHAPFPCESCWQPPPCPPTSVRWS